MAYQHPGKTFISEYGPVQNIDQVLRYPEYLRKEAGLNPTEPAELPRIFERFGMPTPKRAALPNQQGLLLLPDAGLILINESDIETRQRFTEAHELMELLFDALPSGQDWAVHKKGPFKHYAKERLCDIGAAHLLMPPNVFHEWGAEEGVSFGTARKLAARYSVSQTAALVQLVRTSAGKQAVILWRLKHKKAEAKLSAHQLPLFSDIQVLPEKKLRVEWQIGSPAMPHIPKNKSIPENSIIYEALQSQSFTTGEEHIDLGATRGAGFSENLPFETDGERQVISLLTLLQAT